MISCSITISYELGGSASSPVGDNDKFWRESKTGTRQVQKQMRVDQKRGIWRLSSTQAMMSKCNYCNVTGCKIGWTIGKGRAECWTHQTEMKRAVIQRALDDKLLNPPKTKFRCYTCFKEFRFARGTFRMGHKHSASKGGEFEVENLKLCCVKCELSRTKSENMWIGRWAKYIHWMEVMALFGWTWFDVKWMWDLNVNEWDSENRHTTATEHFHEMAPWEKEHW